MISQELKQRSHHYAALLIGEAILLSSFLILPATSVRIVVAAGCGLFYFVWGIWTHYHEIKTMRLMLEYAVIGLLASLMLLAVISNI